MLSGAEKSYSNRIGSFLLTLIAVLVILLSITSCGEPSSDTDLETYMKGKTVERGAIESQLAIINEDAKGSIQYIGNTAEITITYYALTQKEITEDMTGEIKTRCDVIMDDILQQFQKDTGNQGKIKVIIYGSDVEKKQ